MCCRHFRRRTVGDTTFCRALLRRFASFVASEVKAAFLSTAERKSRYGFFSVLWM